MRVELETTNKVQETKKLREEAAKLRVARRYNTKVQTRAFNLVTSYGESEVKPEKILEQESLAPTGKAHSGSLQAWTTEYTYYKNWMAKQFQEHGMPLT